MVVRRATVLYGGETAGRAIPDRYGANRLKATPEWNTEIIHVTSGIPGRSSQRAKIRKFVSWGLVRSIFRGRVESRGSRWNQACRSLRS